MRTSPSSARTSSHARSSADAGGWGAARRAFGDAQARRAPPANSTRPSQHEQRDNIDIVQKLWGFCHTLRHDGIDYGDYIEQITYLLFLKMADERGIDAPEGLRLADAPRRSGTDLTDHYVDVLRKLGKTAGHPRRHLRGRADRASTTRSTSRSSSSLIDETEWTSLDVDVKAAAYEGLLEKAASEGKKGAGQYFTPRILIQSIVRCMKPDPRAKPDFTICDPAVRHGRVSSCAPTSGCRDETKGALDREVGQAGQDEDLLRRRIWCRARAAWH